MAVLVFAGTQDGKLKKNALEATSYAAQCGGDCIAVTLGTVDSGDVTRLGTYGATKVLNVADDRLNNFDSKAWSKAIAQIADQVGADTVVFSQSLNGKSLAPRVAVRLGAGHISGAVSVPDGEGVVKRGAFSGKAFAFVKATSAKRVISVVPNSVGLTETGGSATVEAATVDLADSDFIGTVKEVVRQSGDTLPLPEAELVVSAGRGLKGPENWGMIEDLAKVLGATTACSRPVADVGWRPHHEHVGQTGVAIRPNLYIAIGISGAIQHLAGVNQSKVIVVINKDPEAPFFKAADYGIVGDAFEVVPKLTEAFKNYQG